MSHSPRAGAAPRSLCLWNKGPFCPGPAPRLPTRTHRQTCGRTDMPKVAAGAGVGRTSSSATTRLPETQGCRDQAACDPRLWRPQPLGPLRFQGWRSSVSLTLGRALGSCRARSPEGTLAKWSVSKGPEIQHAPSPSQAWSPVCMQDRGLDTMHVACGPQGAPVPGQGAGSSSLGEVPLPLPQPGVPTSGSEQFCSHQPGPPAQWAPWVDQPQQASLMPRAQPQPPRAPRLASQELQPPGPAHLPCVCSHGAWRFQLGQERQVPGCSQGTQQTHPPHITLMYHTDTHHSHQGHVWSAQGQHGDQSHRPREWSPGPSPPGPHPPRPPAPLMPPGPLSALSPGHRSSGVWSGCEHLPGLQGGACLGTDSPGIPGAQPLPAPDPTRGAESERLGSSHQEPG